MSSDGCDQEVNMIRHYHKIAKIVSFSIKMLPALYHDAGTAWVLKNTGTKAAVEVAIQFPIEVLQKRGSIFLGK